MKRADVFLTCVFFLLVSYGAQAADEKPDTRLSELPVAAQSRISSVLGQDLPGYYALRSGDGFEAANPSQKLTMRFDSVGVEVRSQNLRWRLTFDGYGYGDGVQTTSIARPRAARNRIEYAHGPVTEWYVNGPAGLEQGFTVEEPLDRANRQPLTIALELSGDLAAQLERDRTALTLKARGGLPELHYSGLAASDAVGRRLPAWLETRKARLLLRVNTAGARYPVTIDPLVQAAKITATDGAANDHFGNSVAISGSTVVVGSPAAGGKGAAYVFVKSATGWANMTQTAKLTPSDAGGSLGTSVATSGSVIVAGAPFATVRGRTQQGIAYVFSRPIGGWRDMTQTARLIASDGKSQSRLGQSVAISGNTIVAGAYGAIIGGNAFQGAAYVFVKPPAKWASGTQTAKLTASDGAANNYLGISVAVDGTTVVAGASGATIGSNSGQGAAYVFDGGSGWTNMTQTAKLTASDGAKFDELGNAAAISGNTVVAGALGATIHSNGVQGAGYIFVSPPGGWTDSKEAAKLTASDGAAGDNLGSSVAISGNVVVLGAPTNNVHVGAAYVFSKPSAGWRTTNRFKYKLTANDGVSGDYFGFSVGISRSTLAVGAAFADSFQGKGYVFTP